MLRTPAFTGRRGLTTPRLSSRLMSRRAIQVAAILLFVAVILFIQSVTRVRFSFPSSPQNLMKRLRNPSLAKRFDPQVKWDGPGVLKRSGPSKPVTDEWDWDPTDSYDNYAAVVLEGEAAAEAKAQKAQKNKKKQ